MALVVLFLIFYIFYHHRHTKKKQVLVSQKLSEAENSIRRGFTLLNRDLQAELASLRKSNANRARAEQIMKDLDDIEQYLSNEIWDLERTENS